MAALLLARGPAVARVHIQGLADSVAVPKSVHTFCSARMLPVVFVASKRTMNASRPGQPRCVYCGRAAADGAKLSREHAFTDRAFDLLRVAGSDVHAISPRWEGIKPIEGVTLKDVCRDCNSALSGLDVAGIELVKDVKTRVGRPGGRELPLDSDRLGWLLKTHLNYIRFGPSVNFKQPEIDPRLLEAIRQRSLPPPALYRLFASHMADSPEMWDPNSPMSIQFISQGTFKDAPSEIAIGFLRFLWFVTYLLIPADRSYDGFTARSNEAISHLKSGGIVWHEVLPTRVAKQHKMRLHDEVAPHELLIPAKVLVRVDA